MTSSVFFSILLLVGDSFAFWASRRCVLHESIRTAGRRGGCVRDDSFRRWAIAAVASLRPQHVVLVVGGNDLAHPQYNARIVVHQFHELVCGMLAAGAEAITLFPIPPRSASRSGAVSAAIFHRRRRLTNMLLRRRYRRPSVDLPVAFGSFVPGENFLGRDGVHPSASGWQAFGEWLNAEAHPSPNEGPQ